LSLAPITAPRLGEFAIPLIGIRELASLGNDLPNLIPQLPES
jgi:hypothetical protein